LWVEPDVRLYRLDASSPLSSSSSFIYLFYFFGHQMEEILSGGTPVGAADHSPLATSLGDFEVLGSELDAEGTTTTPPPSLFSTASSQRL